VFVATLFERDHGSIGAASVEQRTERSRVRPFDKLRVNCDALLSIEQKDERSVARGDAIKNYGWINKYYDGLLFINHSVLHHQLHLPYIFYVY
jgi:hypothetical protein